MNRKLMLAAVTVFMSLNVFAGECEMVVNRTPCPGKTDEAFEPYNKVNPTTEKKASANEKACNEQAMKACKIIRKGTLAKKDITAKFNGAAIQGGKNICDSVGESKKECK